MGNGGPAGTSRGDGPDGARVAAATAWRCGTGENPQGWRLARSWPPLRAVTSYDVAHGLGRQGDTGQLLRVSDAAPRTYQPREPEKTVLYPIIRDNLEAFLAEARQKHDRGLPKYVEQEFRAFLDCGIASEGFALAVCDRC